MTISARWNKRLTGRLGATLKGIAYGGLAGVVAGPLLLVALGPMADMPSKFGWGLGIFVGLPLGMFLGGIAGAETPRSQLEAEGQADAGIGIKDHGPSD